MLTEGTGADAVLGEHGVGPADAHQVVCAEGSPHGRSAQIFVLILTQSGDRLHRKQPDTYAQLDGAIKPQPESVQLSRIDCSLPQVSERARYSEAPEGNSGCCRQPASADQSNTWRRR